MSTFSIKVGDRLPTLRAQLLNGDGSPMNLTAATVVFRMRPRGAEPLKVNAAASVYGDPTTGTVDFPWGASDTDTPGTFDGEFAVTLAGLIQTVPASGYVLIQIERVLS